MQGLQKDNFSVQILLNNGNKYCFKNAKIKNIQATNTYIKLFIFKRNKKADMYTFWFMVLIF